MPLKAKKVCGVSDPHNTPPFLRMLLLFIASCFCRCCSTMRKVMGGARRKMKDFNSGHCCKRQFIAQSFYASLAHLLCSTTQSSVVKKLTRGSKNLWNCKESKQMVVCFTSAHFQWNASIQSPKELVPCGHYRILPPNPAMNHPYPFSAHSYEDPCTRHTYMKLIAMYHTAHVHIIYVFQ